MRSIIISSFLLSFVLIQGCGNKNNLFVKQTDVAAAGLKGKVKSLFIIQCSLGDSIEHCYDVSRRKYNTQGFLIEQMDTSGSTISTKKYFYNSDGLLAKVVFASNDSFLRGHETYYTYSPGERIKTEVMRQGNRMIDSFIELYDKNGNEIEFKSGDIKIINKYDGHGFLTWSKLTRPTDSLETRYVNDNNGRVLKITRSDNVGPQIFVYDIDGNQIQKTDVDSKGKATDYLIGYCGFDENGNFLKRITVCKQKKEAFMDRRVIEYY